MKRIFSYLFCFIICFNVVGYFMVFKIRQWSIQEEMDKSNKKTETLVISNSYYKMNVERNGKEIKWQGKMYDIKEARLKGNTVTLKAIHDKEEDSLIEQLVIFLKDKDEGGKESTEDFSNFLQLEFLSYQYKSHVLKYTKAEFIKHKVKPTLEGFAGYNSPPPQLV